MRESSRSAKVFSLVFVLELISISSHVNRGEVIKQHQAEEKKLKDELNQLESELTEMVQADVVRRLSDSAAMTRS